MSIRLTLTAFVMAMTGLLAAILIPVQFRTLDPIAEGAATPTMEAASRTTVSFLQINALQGSRVAWEAK